MPTTRARHMITETPDIRDAIDLADRAWPDLRGDRAALLRRLIERGAQGVLAEDRRRQREWEEVVDRVAGSLTGVYPPGAARLLNEEWPE